MARKKVKLAYIANDAARSVTFKKRRKGLMKKVSELSTLCGVTACAIVYGPHDRQPEVWPSPSDTHRVSMRFKSLPEMERSQKQMNQETFMLNRIGKVSEQLRKTQRDNRCMEISILLNHTLAGKNLLDANTSDLFDLAWMLQERSKEVRDRMTKLNKDPTPGVQTTPGINTAIATPNICNADTTAIPVTSPNTNVNSGGGLNDEVVDHHSQGDGVNTNGNDGQERMVPPDQMSATSKEASQRQTWFMDVLNPPVIPPPEQMMGYLGILGADHGNNNNNQMMGGGVFPVPSALPSYGPSEI
ncbi:hypothetical protein MKX01_021276 [Papaver californicum]|nr:hypothetical protein MKX01_021276 [Papaver californicum]